MHSCFYEGTVAHVRRRPVSHEFRQRVALAWLDLDEVETGGRRLLSNRRYAPIAFRRDDHLFDHGRSLKEEVYDTVEAAGQPRPVGPVRLLTQLRYFGYYFSPLNLFYVYDRRGEQIEAVVAEVNNTPWGERHPYILHRGNKTAEAADLHFAHRKEFHVSPFMPMEVQYRWRLSKPGEQLSVHLANLQGDEVVFDARLELGRRAWSSAALRRLVLRYPIQTAQIGAAIYYQALKLWWKRCPVYIHPRKQQPLPTS